MQQRKKAGHLTGARVVDALNCVVVTGYLLEDKRGTHHTGEPRNFSRSNIHTSWVERFEYNQTADTTVIFTRNSIYFAPGNLIKDFLGLNSTYAEGKQEILDQFVKFNQTEKVLDGQTIPKEEA